MDTRTGLTEASYRSSRPLREDRPVNFTSPAFFAFLPAILVGYHALRSRTAKYRLLLLASWLFYVSWNPWYLWVLLAPTVIDFWSRLLLDAERTDSLREPAIL